MTTDVLTTDVPGIAAAIDEHDRFLVATHENPDGDALGSMLAATLGLRALGKDAVMYLTGTAPTPAEYRFLDLSGLVRALPADVGERVLLAVDCANERRIGPEPDPVERVKLVLNVDHHHDNSRFGDLNLIDDDASSTAEIVRDILRALDVPLTPDIAEALYVGLVTDTGRFQYTNTTPKALRLAAELVESGADVHGVFQHVYETVQFAKLKLLARAARDGARVCWRDGCPSRPVFDAEPSDDGMATLWRPLRGPSAIRPAPTWRRRMRLPRWCAG
jgi:phosphoesterase RecJ-like protein